MGQLRIISGDLRGRKIDVPPGEGIRPTADRVREALFSILADAVVDANVVDAYSGSGALGFEALSRGAASVVFVEANRGAVATLRRTAERLGVVDRCRILCGRAELLVDRSDVGPVDLILADPPYAVSNPDVFLQVSARKLSPGGTMVVERDRRAKPPDTEGFRLERYRTATYGGTCLDFYRVAGSLERSSDSSDT